MNEHETALTPELCHTLGTELKTALCLDRLVAVAFLKSEAELPQEAVRPVRDMHAHLALCQAIRLCRTMGNIIGMTIDDHFCMPGASALGFTTFTRSFDAAHTRDSEAACKLDAVLLERDELIPKKTYKAMLIAPLDQTPLVPDVILAYGNPGQIGRLCKCFTYAGEPVTGFYMGGVGCSAISAVFVQQKPCFGLPAGGEKMLAGTTDHEMNFLFPANRLPEVVKNFHGTQRILPYPTIHMSLLQEPASTGSYKMSYEERLPDD